MHDTGYDRRAFSVRFKAHCRKFCNSNEAGVMGEPWEKAACMRMSELTGDPLTIIEAVHRGDHDPTEAILRHMNWMSYETFEIVTERRPVTYYLPRSVTTNRPNSTL